MTDDILQDLDELEKLLKEGNLKELFLVSDDELNLITRTREFLKKEDSDE